MRPLEDLRASVFSFSYDTVSILTGATDMRALPLWQQQQYHLAR